MGFKEFFSLEDFKRKEEEEEAKEARAAKKRIAEEKAVAEGRAPMERLRGEVREGMGLPREPEKLWERTERQMEGVLLQTEEAKREAAEKHLKGVGRERAEKWVKESEEARIRLAEMGEEELEEEKRRHPIGGPIHDAIETILDIRAEAKEAALVRKEREAKLSPSLRRKVAEGIILGGAAGHVAGRARGGPGTLRRVDRTLRPQVSKERLGLYTGTREMDVATMYGATGMRGLMVPQTTSFAQLMDPRAAQQVQPRPKPSPDLSRLQALTDPRNVRLPQAGPTTAPMPQPTRAPMLQPTTAPTRIPALLTQQAIPREVEQILKPDEQLLEQYQQPIWFKKGFEKGAWELGRDVWITQMQTGSFRFVGIGQQTGEPRSKIIGKDPDRALIVAAKRT